MKSTIVTMAVSVVLAGCGPSKQSQSGSDSTNVSAEEVKQEMKEAADATKNYIAENKDQFIASAEQKLIRLDQQIAELGTKTETLKDEAKAEGSKALAALREQRAQLGRKLDELKTSSKEAWKDVKAGFESAFDELEKAYQNAKSKFGA